MTDTLYTPAFDELQARASIPTIESQNVRRQALIAEIEADEKALAPLATKYAYTSSYWDVERSVQKSMCVMLVNDAIPAGERRPTEKVLEAMAYAHPQFRKWLDRTEKERLDYNVRRAELEAKKKALGMLDDEVARATSLVRFAASERMNG